MCGISLETNERLSQKNNEIFQHVDLLKTFHIMSRISLKSIEIIL